MQTGYLQLDETGAAAAVLLGARATVSYRLSARQAGRDVQWSAFQLLSTQAVNGLAASNAQNSEEAVTELTEQHLRSEDTRSVLNRLRVAVCGGGDFFTSTHPAVQAASGKKPKPKKSG